jgi:hypothetical protein
VIPEVQVDPERFESQLVSIIRDLTEGNDGSEFCGHQA